MAGAGTLPPQAFIPRARTLHGLQPHTLPQAHGSGRPRCPRPGSRGAASPYLSVKNRLLQTTFSNFVGDWCQAQLVACRILDSFSLENHLIWPVRPLWWTVFVLLPPRSLGLGSELQPLHAQLGEHVPTPPAGRLSGVARICGFWAA